MFHGLPSACPELPILGVHFGRYPSGSAPWMRSPGLRCSQCVLSAFSRTSSCRLRLLKTWVFHDKFIQQIPFHSSVPWIMLFWSQTFTKVFCSVFSLTGFCSNHLDKIPFLPSPVFMRQTLSLVSSIPRLWAFPTGSHICWDLQRSVHLCDFSTDRFRLNGSVSWIAYTVLASSSQP